jgi:hypothetical protein
LLTERLLKLATPEVAFIVRVPLNDPPAGLVPIAMVIDADDDVTVLPKLSCTVTLGGPAIALPALALAGWVVKATLIAAAALILKALLVALVSPVADAVSV